MGSIRLHESEDHQAVIAVLESLPADEKIDSESVKNQLTGAGYQRLKVADGAINQLVEVATNITDDTQPELPQSFIIATRVDAKLQIKLPPDKLSAIAIIRTAYGGKPITPEHVKQALQESEVRRGINQKALGLLLKESYKASPGTVLKRRFATGKPAKDGIDGCWISDTQTLLQQLSTPQKREDGTVDMLDFGEILTVSEGELLMHLEPPTEGENGFTVTGELLPAVPGKECPFMPAEGVALGENPHHIVATRQGIPVEHARGIRVDQIYTTQKVDLSSGNITFDGSVIVQGNVEDAMRIEATGDVTVGGSVHHATIIAGGNILVRQGVFGKQVDKDIKQLTPEDLNCCLCAEGEVHVGFAQYTQLRAREGIQVDKQLLHCHSTTYGQLALGNEKERQSKLIGGVTLAAQGISGAHYGTDAFIPTLIELCHDAEELLEQEKAYSGQLSGQKELLDQLEPILPKLVAIKSKPGVEAKLKKVIQTIKHTRKQMDNLQLQMGKLRNERDERLKTCTLLARGMIYPNVKVSIAGQTFKISREYPGGGIHYSDGEIQYSPDLK